MIGFEKTFDMKENLTISIKRILMNEGVFENCNFLKLQNSAYYVAGDYLDKEPHILPKLYAALRCLTGPGDFRYDNYKGSYNFTFELEVKKNRAISQYLYRIYHYRSYIEFSVEQAVHKTDPRNVYTLHEPDDTLFSDEDIGLFSTYFCGYALGFMKDVKYTPKPFVKYSDSDFLIFGFYNNEYFTLSYDDQCKHKNEKVLWKILEERGQV